MAFHVVSTIKIPDDVIYRFSVDEWRSYLKLKYHVDPDSITSFESVAEHIADMWASGFSEFEQSGIFVGIETRKV